MPDSARHLETLCINKSFLKTRISLYLFSMETVLIQHTHLRKETENKFHKFAFISQIKISTNILILWLECDYHNDTGSESRKPHIKSEPGAAAQSTN
jgi:uncharacterized alpha/beta hydrolase family protein